MYEVFLVVLYVSPLSFIILPSGMMLSSVESVSHGFCGSVIQYGAKTSQGNYFPACFCVFIQQVWFLCYSHTRYVMRIQEHTERG